MTEQEYFDYKTEGGTPVLSSSMLKIGMPCWGGNQYRLNAYYNKQISKSETKEMQFGTLVHRYAEDHTRFVFQPEWEMSDKMQLIADRLYTFLTRMQIKVEDSLIPHTAEFELIAKEEEWGQHWKAETRFTKFRGAVGAYWLFLIEASGKIAVTGSDVEKINKVIKGIEDADLRVPLLDDSSNPGVKTYRELAIKFMIDGKYPAKSLVDILEINDEQKTATITDLKTTAMKVENFISGYGYLPDPETGVVKKTPFKGDYIKWGYFFQEFFYKKAVSAWLAENGKELYTITFQFGVVETSEPFLAQMIKANPSWMSVASMEFGDAMKNVELWFAGNDYDKF